MRYISHDFNFEDINQLMFCLDCVFCGKVNKEFSRGNSKPCLEPVISNPDSMFPLWPVANFFVYCIQIWFKRKYVVKSCAKSFTFVSVHMRLPLTSTLRMIFHNWLWDIYFEITWRFLKILLKFFWAVIHIFITYM